MYFPDPVYHMFDFTGTGSEEVITLDRGRVRVFGARNAAVPVTPERDPDFLRHKITNHTHY